MQRRKRLCVSFAYPVSKAWYPTWPLIHLAERRFYQYHVGKFAVAIGIVKLPKVTT